MGMDRVAATARVVPTEASGTGAGLTLAALIDVLDRADAVLVPTRSRPRRGAMHRSPSARTVADRWDPLRDLGTRSPSAAGRAGGTSRAVVRSAGGDRPAPRVVQARAVPLRSVPPAPPARLPVLPALVAAGAGTAAQGPAASAQRAAGRLRTSVGARLRAVLVAVVRRAALWGAGPGGTHLAWGAPAPARTHRAGAAGPPAPPRRADPPVVLRELPSTPTVRPAPGPARGTGPAAPGPACRNTPARALRTAALSTVRRIPPLPPASRSVPSRARSPGGVRGSSRSGSARGSPPREPEPGRAPDACRYPRQGAQPSPSPLRTVRTGPGSPPSPWGS